ncbi:Flp family type IVb pilin [Helcococcus ovis]
MARLGIILALISVVVIAILSQIGTQLNEKFKEILTKLGGNVR